MAFGDADASTPAFVSVNSNWTSTGATSASFTPPSGSTVVLSVMADTSSGANPGNETVTDSIAGATGWTFLRRRAKPDSGSQAGTCALWYKVYASAPGSPITVTVVGNATGGASGGFSTRVVGNCDGLEGDAEGSNTAAAVSLSITSTTDGARGMVMATDWNVQANMTAGTSQTAVLASSVGSGPDTRVYVGIQNAVTSPAGSVTMSTASPTSGNANNFIGWFLKPSAGATNLSVGNDALSVAAGAATVAASLAAGNGAVAAAANAVTLSALLAAGNAALSAAANPATLALSVAAGNGAVSVGAFNASVTSGSSLAVGGAAASAVANGAALVLSTAVGNGAVGAVSGGVTLSSSLAAGFGAVSVGAYDATVTVTGATSLGVGNAIIGVGAYDVQLTGGTVVTVAGSWQGLLDILNDIRAETAQQLMQPPIACPRCGEPLETARGVLHCRFDSWTSDLLTL
jgi:hypothetical protein